MARQLKHWIVAVSFGLCILVGASSATADEYDPSYSAHPLRVVGYVLHPVGVIIDTLIFRPAHWLVQWDFTKKLFGHQDL